jgi:hypothetical protein
VKQSSCRRRSTCRAPLLRPAVPPGVRGRGCRAGREPDLDSGRVRAGHRHHRRACPGLPSHPGPDPGLVGLIGKESRLRGAPVQDVHAPSFVGTELPSHPKPRQERRVRATIAFKRCMTPPPAAGDTWTWARSGCPRGGDPRCPPPVPGGGPTNSTPAPAARARSRRRRVPAREDPGGGGPAGAAAPLGPGARPHPSALAAGRTPAGSRPRSPVRWSAPRRSRCTDPGHARQARQAGRLGQMGAGRAVLLARLARSARSARSTARGCARAGLPRQSEDGGRCEFEESWPSRRSSSTIRVCSVAISRACSALDARNSAMTAA